MADWLDEITLITPVAPETQADRVNSNGFATEAEETKNVVFCNKKPVGYNEFFKSQQLGIVVSFKVEVHKVDYDGQLLADYGGKRYTVLKTYEIDDDIIELTLSDLRE